MSATAPIRVLIADDDEMMRRMLSGLIESEPSLTLAGAAKDTDEAIALAEAQQPDVALLDLEMPGGGGWKAAEEIGQKSPRTRILALTAIDTPEARLASMRAGAIDFLPKGSGVEKLIDAIRGAMNLYGEEPAQPEARSLAERVADLEQRMSSLEQSLVKLLVQVGPAAGSENRTY